MKPPQKGSSLESQLDAITRKVVERCFEANPELDIRYGQAGRAKCLQDTRYHLQYLNQALSANSLPLFLDYIQWAKILLWSVKVPEADFISNLRVMESVLEETLDGKEKRAACEFIRAGAAALPGMSQTFPSFVDHERPNGMLAKTYLNLVLAGQPREATQLVVRAAETGTPVRDIYLQVFQPTQREIGRLWQTNQISVAQEHHCSAITERAMTLLSSRITPLKGKNGLRLLACCAGTELHELGIRMVADFLEADGWEVFFTGANTPLAGVLRIVREQKIDLVALSATMPYHVEAIMRLIAAIRADETTGSVKIMVGGYPFNVDRELWMRVGADAYGVDAEHSASEAARLVSPIKQAA